MAADLGFTRYVNRKMSITPDWTKISASNFTLCIGIGSQLVLPYKPW